MIESEYAEQLREVQPFAGSQVAHRGRLRLAVQDVAHERPVYTPSTDSATVPSAPVRSSRWAMIVANSTGVAVTSHVRWPASRCSRARASVPDQILSAISSS